MGEKPSLTTAEAGKLLGVGVHRVRQFIDEKRLKAQKVGRDWLIYPSSLAKFKRLPRGPKGKRSGK
ncbi:MAG TPA: helix-turn-helix domain-containing protein [Tepidisphaeraceae bacterium]|jgi:excisionase family DNA binding protein|nr:helix-turn-helix domain-containing protein [Tepidisphaeraceae bacterium]